ncbi:MULTISPECIES: sensor histidine kinase [unclassified Brevibacterium]|uniref:sensor histidine kinase n=1 Tax=unclassified Brevibacterium TaxID=2614124 RepID=UPI002017C71E|nr:MULTISPECIES: sensor histidine kinase [unclassified Brevibacterium]MCM1011341.1 ATP-binding protein [Brevibacterium sp. XM4083]
MTTPATMTTMMTTMMTMTAVTMTTTDRRIRLTVENRLTIAVSVLSVLALTIVGVVLYSVESNNVSNRISGSMNQEVAEMRSFAKTGVDPETGQPFTSVDQMLSQFLAQNQPDSYESLFAYLSDGRVLYQGEPDTLLGGSQALEDAVARVAADGGEIELQLEGNDYEGYVLPVSAVASANDAAGATPPPTSEHGSFVVVHNVTASRADLIQFMQIYVIVALLAALIISGISSVLARRLLSPVTQLRQTAQSISGGDLSNRLETRGSDDIAELGRTFNAMLDRLESAFETQRRFLDDVGHELRTPLTILSGHLETMNSEDVADVDETRALLLDETDRMTRLVEELLVLARSRRPDFVRPESVDVSALLHGVLAKATGLGPRNWQVEITDLPVLTADRQRLTQALLQLAANAVDHTETGQTITFGASEDATAVHLWVRDDGEGVPAEIADEIFDRFNRGTSDGDGFGLGLSIVEAIARAHGGTVTLDPTEVGAQFRLTLPKGRQ